MWICQNCKEDNEDNFDICWNCQCDKNENAPIVVPENELKKGIQEPEVVNRNSNSQKAYSSSSHISEGYLCPFSWIQVTEPAGCLASLFGGKDKLVWQPQPCMTSKCKLWNISTNNCGLLSK